jgi:hypothetical protein
VACVNFAGTANSYTGSVSLSKLDLQQYGGTADGRDLVTPPAVSDDDTLSHAISASGVNMAFGPSGSSIPIDMKVWFENAAERITPR